MARYECNSDASLEVDRDLEMQMREGRGSEERAVNEVLERSRERKRGLKFGKELLSSKGVGEGIGRVDRGRERVEWENRVGR
jgi:hypothetical protein